MVNTQRNPCIMIAARCCPYSFKWSFGPEWILDIKPTPDYSGLPTLVPHTGVARNPRGGVGKIVLLLVLKRR